MTKAGALKSKLRAGVIALCAVAAGMVGCGSGEPDVAAGPPTLSGKLVITGSSTVAPLATEIGKRFESLHPSVRVDVQTGGSSRGIADARSGLADIGMASRALKDSEADLFTHTIARDGVAMIVHATNPVAELSDEQIVAIYRGEIENWKDVGGKDAEIVVVNKAAGRATLEVFVEHFRLEPGEIRAAVVVGDNQHGINTVSGNENAIGYVSIGTADYEVREGRPLRLLPVGGVPATIESVASGAFPMSRPLNLVTRAAPEGLAREFIEFAQSDRVHDLIEAQYFVPAR